MSGPVFTKVDASGAASRAGVALGDEVMAIDGVAPRDVLEWRQLLDEEEVTIDILRGNLSVEVVLRRAPGEPLGAEVQAAIFDEVQTCDNHCEFCFIYQLPPGMRRSLYLKDDDYRLSFLYGNFTTLTRFTEADFERVVTEGLSPLYVSIHATDPDVRAEMLRNQRGAFSLRWLRLLLEANIEVHGQVVVCPGVNDGEVLESTLAGIYDRYSDLASVAVVPLGVSDHHSEPRMRPHTPDEARAVVDAVESWQVEYEAALGRRLVHAADEYYLLADRRFPPAEAYGQFEMHEDGIGMARAFERDFRNPSSRPHRPASGFFAWVDGAPAEGYRAPRTDGSTPVTLSRRADDGSSRDQRPVGIVTAPYGARVLAPLLDGIDSVRLVVVENRFFGGNIAVTGLMTGPDVSRALEAEPVGHRYLLPDVCLSEGRFLDGTGPGDLPRPVEVIPTDGAALARAVGR